MYDYWNLLEGIFIEAIDCEAPLKSIKKCNLRANAPSLGLSPPYLYSCKVASRPQYFITHNLIFLQEALKSFGTSSHQPGPVPNSKLKSSSPNLVQNHPQRKISGVNFIQDFSCKGKFQAKIIHYKRSCEGFQRMLSACNIVMLNFVGLL